MIISKFTGAKVTSSSDDSFSMCERSCLGEKKDNKIEYSLVEALFLLYERKMTVFLGNKVLTEEQFIKKIKKTDKRIETKFAVFKNIRKKGYIIKTGLKFGADFRVYDKGAKPGKDHARWILYCVQENEAINWHEFAAKNRIAHSTKKNLLIAIVDEESDVSYYEISWLKP